MARWRLSPSAASAVRRARAAVNARRFSATGRPARARHATPISVAHAQTMSGLIVTSVLGTQRDRSVMVAYSFKQQFVAPILSGAKCQTIRADRKRHVMAGEETQLYTGMRTKQCRLIGRATCIGTVPVTINLTANFVTVGGAVYKGWADLDAFARHDGFEDWLAMRGFWHDNHPGIKIFSGVLIRWASFQAAT